MVINKANISFAIFLLFLCFQFDAMCLKPGNFRVESNFTRPYTPLSYDQMMEKLPQLLQDSLKGNSGKQISSRLWEISELLVKLNVKECSESEKKELCEFLLESMNHYLNNKRFVDFLEDWKNKSASASPRWKKHAEPYLYGVFFLPAILFRKVITISDSNETSDRISEIILEIHNREYRAILYSIFLRCLTTFTPQKDVSKYADVFRHMLNELTEHPEEALSILQGLDIRKKGLPAFFEGLALELKKQAETQSSFDHFMLTHSYAASNSGIVLSPKEMRSLFQSAQSLTEKLLIIRIGLLFMGFPPDISIEEYKTYISNIDESKISSNEKRLLLKSREACDIYMKHICAENRK